MKKEILGFFAILSLSACSSSPVYGGLTPEAQAKMANDRMCVQVGETSVGNYSNVMIDCTNDASGYASYLNKYASANRLPEELCNIKNQFPTEDIAIKEIARRGIDCTPYDQIALQKRIIQQQEQISQQQKITQQQIAKQQAGMQRQQYFQGLGQALLQASQPAPITPQHNTHCQYNSIMQSMDCSTQ